MTAAERKLSLAIAVIWPLLAVLFVLTASQRFTVPDLSVQFSVELFWAALTPALLVVNGRLSRASRAAAWAGHLAAITGCALSVTAVESLLSLAYGMPLPALAQQATVAIPRYAVIAAAAAGLRRQRRLYRHDTARARNELRLAEAEAAEVRMTLDEAAVVSTLNRIADDIGGRAQVAEDAILVLCRTLRAKLGRTHVRLARRRPLPSVKPAVSPALAALVYPSFGICLNLIWSTQMVATGQPLRVRHSLNLMIVFAVAGLTSPMVVETSRRLHVEAGRWWWRIVVLGLVCLAHGAVTSGCMLLLGRLMTGPRPMLGFFMVVTLSLALAAWLQFEEYSRRARHAGLASARLQYAVAEAHLRGLHRQLTPHFLFNTLNTILAYVRRAPETARHMLLRLTELLSATAESRRTLEVPLREELAMTMAYVEIEQVRFREALDLRLDVGEGALDLLVPPFLLQPLVENAIRHGVLSTTGAGTVRVSLRCQGDALELEIENDAPLIDPSSWRRGIGLSNVSALLELLYGNAHHLAIETVATRGVRIRIRIPARTATFNVSSPRRH
jgi:Histidine kinase